MLILFDLDGTLIEGYMDRADKDYARVVFPDNVLVALEELDAGGHVFGIVTNQAGIAFGYNTEEDYQRKIGEVLTQLGWPLANVRVCFAHPSAPDDREQYKDPVEVARRKPNPTMLLELMADLGYNSEQTVYVGDMDTDAQAAANASVAFYWAKDFFDNGLYLQFT